jgi:chromosomal replication initiator protein
MYLARKMTNASYPDIGEKIGGRDHSTIIYAYNKIKKALEDDTKLLRLIHEIEETMNKD